MKVLILGGTGMVGHTISIYFMEKGHDVTILSRRKVDFAYCIVGDAKNEVLLNEIIKVGNYDAIINAVGILNEDADNHKSEAVLLNSYLPHLLVKLTENSKTKIVHMSTDCVFSGREGGYNEKSFRDGETFYDRTKALGEIENDKDLTLRCSIIGPDMNSNGIGLFNWFMKQKNQLNGYEKVIWTGVTTLTLAKAIEQACEDNLTGLYNLVNNETINKYELLKLFNKTFKGNQIKILKSKYPVVNKSLINTRNDFSFEVPSYEAMIFKMKNWIIEHRDLYPHYFN